jgi:hypothetical protein
LFYEALRTEMRRTERWDHGKMGLLAAAAEQCSKTDFAAISSEAVLIELRAALGLLLSGRRNTVPRTTANARHLRVIKGGRS